MNLIKIATVGKLHRNEIDRLNEAIQELKISEKADKKELVEVQLEGISEHEDVRVETQDNGRVELYVGDCRWSAADVYIDDNYFNKETVYDVRFNVSGFSGNTGSDHDLYAKLAVCGIAGEVVGVLGAVVDQYEAIAKEYSAKAKELYDQKRQLLSELGQLKEIAEEKNAKVITEALVDGIDLTEFANDGKKYRLYTGYGGYDNEDYEFVTKIKTIRSAGKSILLESENIWSDGVDHPREIRVKKDVLFETVTELLTKNVE